MANAEGDSTKNVYLMFLSMRLRFTRHGVCIHTKSLQNGQPPTAAKA